jgi:hypothetical protein
MYYLAGFLYRFFTRQYFQKNAGPLIALTAAVFFIWYPITLLDFSVTRFPIVEEGAKTFFSSPGWPVQDSYASATQDEPWMVLIGRSMRKGDLPIVNLFNGLGAPLAESMQAGVFYPLNILLPALPLSRPLSFDLFMLLHMFIFTYGLYALYRRFASPWNAASIALLIAGSGVVFSNINMVHFRSLTWLPWILVTSFIIISTKNRIWPIPATVLFFVLHLTAGSLQDSIITSGVIVFFTMTYGFICYREYFAKQAMLYVAVLFSGISIGSVGFVSFLIAQSQGVLSLTDGPVRALQSVNWYYMASWILPKFKGIYPFFIISKTDQQNQPDISILFAVLCFLGLAVTTRSLILYYKTKETTHKSIDPLSVWACVIAAVVFLGLIKTAHIPIFDFFQYIPFIESLKFAKYNLWIAVVAGIIAAVGLEKMTDLSITHRRRLFSIALGSVVVIASGMIFAAMMRGTSVGQSVFALFPGIIQKELLISFFANIFGLLLCSVIFFTRRISTLARARSLFVVVVFVSMSMMPFGWYQRDSAWISPGQTMLVREISQRVSNDAIDPEDRPRLLLGAPHSNRSSFLQEETVSVWDPVLNRAYQQFLTAHFDIDVPDLLLQPSRATPLDQKAVAALQFLGVDAVQGYSIDSTVPSEAIRKERIKNTEVTFIQQTVPRVFFLTTEQYKAAQSLYQGGPSNLQAVVDFIQQAQEKNRVEAIAFTDISGIQTNSIELQYRVQEPGYLIIAQAYTPAWKLNSVDSADVFAGLYPAWSVSATDSDIAATAQYRIPGLRAILALMTLGLVVCFLTMVYAYKESKNI